MNKLKDMVAVIYGNSIVEAAIRKSFTIEGVRARAPAKLPFIANECRQIVAILK